MTEATQNWPLNIDFTSAVQNPHVCFRDSRLQRSQIMKNSRGRVLLWSGNFATVYKLIDRECAWAVRCFTRVPQPDVQQRYAAISDYLNQHRLSYLVNFQFIPEGILIKEQWYPVLKMDWVEGLELDRFIGEHINDPSRLELLNQQLRQLKQDLRTAGIAHGDLQHGNIMVTTSGQLKLVDYDGMYVPALSGKPPVETGHPNYQPPERSPHDFDENVDDFSFDVISLSLSALAKQPELWESFHEDNKNLIFRQDDFRQPQTSPVFQSISLINDVDTQILYTQLVQKCSADIVTADKKDKLAQVKATISSLELPTLSLPPIRKQWLVASAGFLFVATCVGTLMWARDLFNRSETSTIEPIPTQFNNTSTLTTTPLSKDELISQYRAGKRDFQQVNLSKVNLNNAVLSGINLSGSNLEETNLYQANLSNSNLKGVTFVNSDMRGADLNNANLIDANLSDTNLGQANLTKANLLRANLSKAKLDNATLRGAVMMKANLREANLGLANLSAANLLLADLRKANLLKANLRETNLNAADLTEAKLDSADLLLADLRSSELYLANLSSANLSAADLSSANIVLADLAGTNLSGTNLSNAKIDNISSIQDANFTNVVNLSATAKQYFCAIAIGTVQATKKSTKTTLNCL